eukprot:COSAG01_NODE_519_length_16012_cov_4.344058_11_plen_73_part_00
MHCSEIFFFFVLKYFKNRGLNQNNDRRVLDKFDKLKDEIEDEKSMDDLKKKAKEQPEKVAKALEVLLSEEVK